MTLKQKIHTQYLALANNRVFILQQTLADLKESGSNETKSTAGDKHETALAMLQIEQTNIRGQLQNALEQQAALSNINPLFVSDKIINGSLVKTNKGYFYASLALGKIVVDCKTVFAVSQQSPLGEKLMGLVVGDAAQVNNNKYLVEAIL